MMKTDEIHGNSTPTNVERYLQVLRDWVDKRNTGLSEEENDEFTDRLDELWEELTGDEEAEVRAARIEDHTKGRA